MRFSASRRTNFTTAANRLVADSVSGFRTPAAARYFDRNKAFLIRERAADAEGLR